MRKKVAFLVTLVVLVGGGFYLWQNYRGALPVFLGSREDITEQIPPTGQEQLPDAVNNTEFPLTLPKGFSISILAKNLPGARDIVQDSFGNLWVSQTSEGKITQLEIQNGVVVRANEIFRGLKRPHGLALDGTMLYFAEETKISRVPLYSDGQIEKLVDLPAGGRHYTRSLKFGSDGLLYVSIGSTCDVCYEKDEKFAAIYSMQKDGTGFRQVSRGLRNSVFMAVNPVDGKLWATEMGRDNLGNDLPPDEINIIEDGKDYGWPVCYGQNVHD
ncbi:MAG: PQQ-dependent sugar dehydrogenase, partial [Candidatus Doudnabacteria bacterium]|nr:PQQ-dependent sugar dehydrogenase [Candidatus Doudnabacteria bacterium]